MGDSTAPSQHQKQRVTESEALIESSFRRLVASIETEREKIRHTWGEIDEEQHIATDELERLKLDTEEWCNSERSKIQSEWRRLDDIRERMSVLWPADKKEVLLINCSGHEFQLPKRCLCVIEGSYLNHMFSDAYMPSIPRDAEGLFYLDFNPACFGIIVDWLISQEGRKELTPPEVPLDQQQNMDILCEALHLRTFLSVNRVSQHHATSLRVDDNMIRATHSGWQVISSERPLTMSGPAYFEVRILRNPDPITDRLAVGVCGHVPEGTEAHSIRIKDSVLYNSNVGLIGSAIFTHNVQEKLQFAEGNTLGVKHDVATRTLHFYFNKLAIGSCSLKQEALEKMKVLYPVFALHVPEQKVEVDFTLTGPLGSRGVTGGTTTLDASSTTVH